MAVLIEELEKEVNERIRLGEKLEELATTDGLTGVLNRRRFDDVLSEEWQRWSRYGNTFALLLIDIDHFKSINDTHGHMTGDEVLRRLGKTLREVVRTEDTVARYGGEEFAVVAVGAGRESAVELARRLRDGIRDTPMPDPVGAITVSLGISSASEDVQSAAELINQADEALYRAKKNGRDRFEIF